MLDILELAASLSLKFQKDSLTCSDAIDALEVFCASIEGLKHQDGDQLAAFVSAMQDTTVYMGVTIKKSDPDDAQFDAKKPSVLNDILEFTSKRFLAVEDNIILKSTSVLEFSSMPTDPEAFAKYGLQELDNLTKHFQIPLENAGFDYISAKNELIDLKVYSRNHLQSLSFVQLWCKIFAHVDLNTRFRNLAMLAEMIMCFPFNTACCERAFSVMKRTKTDWRSSLDTDTLDAVLRIIIDGPELEKFVPNAAVHLFWTKCTRSRRPNFMNNK